MEDAGSIWQIGIIALLAGAMIGVLVYRLFSPSVKQADQIKSDLDAAREELSSFKASVNQHFDKTSELVNNLTQNYVRVYQHLAEGAQTLGDSKTFNNLLEQRPGRVSIALDESETVGSDRADDRIVEAAVTTAPTAQAVDEHAEPFTEVTTAQAASDVAEADTLVAANDDGESATAESARDADGPTTDGEPAPNLEALDEAAAKADSETGADKAGVIPESEEKTKPGTTIH